MQKERGLRQGYLEVWPLLRGDIVITFSPDGNSVAELIPALIARMAEGYDMVIVSRYLGNAKSDDDNWITAFGNWFFTKTVNVLHGGNYTDCMVMFRAYKRDLIHALEFQQEGFRHNDVHAVGAIYRHALVFKSERSLPAEGNFLKFEFPAQAGLIGGLQQSGAKRLVNFHGATDDLGNKRVVF